MSGKKWYIVSVYFFSVPDEAELFIYFYVFVEGRQLLRILPPLHHKGTNCPR